MIKKLISAAFLKFAILVFPWVLTQESNDAYYKQLNKYLGSH